MPRSKVKPTVSTYHEAVNLIISTISPKISTSLPLTKKGDKFTSKGLVYLSGMFDLPINSKIQDIYTTIVDIYSIPPDFITWVRVMQQTENGNSVPKIYSDFRGLNAQVFEVLADLWTESMSDVVDGCEPEREVGYDSKPDSVTDQVSDVVAESVTNPKPDWDTLAAANPLAAQFVQSLMAGTDDDDNEYDHGSDDGDEE